MWQRREELWPYLCPAAVPLPGQPGMKPPVPASTYASLLGAVIILLRAPEALAERALRSTVYILAVFACV